MVSQRNRNFEVFHHKKIGKNRQNRLMCSKAPSTNFSTFALKINTSYKKIPSEARNRLEGPKNVLKSANLQKNLKTLCSVGLRPPSLRIRKTDSNELGGVNNSVIA